MGDAETRSLAAAALWKAGWAPARARDERGRPRRRGPASLRTRNQRSHAAGLRGSPPSHRGAERPSQQHDRRGQRLAQYLTKSPDRRVLVVTNEFHTRRARWAFDWVLGSQAGQITVVSVPSDDFRTDAWWQVVNRVLHNFRRIPKIRVLQLAIWSSRPGYAGLPRAAGGLGGPSPPAAGRQGDRVDSIIGV